VPLRPPPGVVPESPGVYRFKDERDGVIYVGKARNLRARLASYFGDPATLHPRTAHMVASARAVDWITTATEVEALHLEYTWIKEFDPRFNVRFRDDKSYPYLAITVGEEFPRVMVVRGAKRSGIRYFGPYTHAWAIRETMDHLLRVFPMRSCSQGVFRRAERSRRPCLLGDIGKCSAPCVGRVDAETHRSIVEDFCAFMSGSAQRYMRRLAAEMASAAADLDYERAARLRDDLSALERVAQRSAVVLPEGTDVDVVALAEDDLEAVVHVFHVRHGRIRGERALVVEKVDEVEGPDLLTQVLRQFYGDSSDDVPRQIICRPEPADSTVLAEWLRTLRGGPVDVQVPSRGARVALLDTVQRNADEALTLQKVRRSGDLTSRAAALEELRAALGLDQPLLRIECIDISHLAGRDVTGSLVVFEDGLPRPREYRTYGLQGEEARDDLRSIEHVVARRFRRLGEYAADAAPEGRRSGFAYPPALLIVDGGPLQAAAAARAVAAAGASLPVVGIAKRLEELWLAGEEFPVILPRGSDGLFLVQRIRDEAHRVAVKAQRARRARTATASALDTVPGVGPARAGALLKHFGSVKRIRAASVEDLMAVPGVGRGVAEQIRAALDVPGAADGTG